MSPHINLSLNEATLGRLDRLSNLWAISRSAVVSLLIAQEITEIEKERLRSVK